MGAELLNDGNDTGENLWVRQGRETVGSVIPLFSTLAVAEAFDDHLEDFLTDAPLFLLVVSLLFTFSAEALEIAGGWTGGDVESEFEKLSSVIMFGVSTHLSGTLFPAVVFFAESMCIGWEGMSSWMR